MEQPKLINEEVAILVMGWRIEEQGPYRYYQAQDEDSQAWRFVGYYVEEPSYYVPTNHASAVWNPVEDIEQAFKVLNRVIDIIRSKEEQPEIGIGTCGADWRCEIQTDRWVFDEEGETAGEAICKAALATIAGMDEPWEDDHA